MTSSISKLSDLLSEKVKNTNHFGSLSWDANNFQIMNLDDVPKSALIKNGDTIQTGGRWKSEEMTHHINYLEMLAIFFALQSFENHIANKYVFISFETLYTAEPSSISGRTD